MSENIKQHFKEATSVLAEFLANEENFVRIQMAGDMMLRAIQSDRKILSCGNGGSMCDAMHFAEEMTGRYRKNRKALPALAISDASHITCAANDYGMESIFSRMVEAVGNKNDVLLCISTSGNSENILRAAEVAKQKGLKTVALTGKDGGKLGQIVDVEIRVPHMSWSDRIQEIHIKVIHSLIDYIETALKEQNQ